MTRRLLALGLATAMLMLGGMNARAGSVIPLPTHLDSFVLSNGTSNGNTTTSGGLTFSGFGYDVVGPGTHPTASDINVLPPATSGPGLLFHGLFSADPGAVVDYLITYTVTAPVGTPISDSSLVIAGGQGGGTGSGDVGESISWKALDGTTKASSLDATFPPGSVAASTPLDVPTGVSITVFKDIKIDGGSLGASVTAIEQDFSVVAEPMSMTLLGIGLTGLFTFRRFLKRVFIA